MSKKTKIFVGALPDKRMYIAIRDYAVYRNLRNQHGNLRPLIDGNRPAKLPAAIIRTPAKFKLRFRFASSFVAVN